MDILQLSKYIILRLIQLGVSITPLKLQRILYFMQAWHLVYFDKTLMFNDATEAWASGPTYSVVYNKYKKRGNYSQITLSSMNIKRKDLEKALKNSFDKLDLDDDNAKFVESIIKHYGMMDVDKLAILALCQQPWSKARRGLDPFDYSGQIVSNDDMYNYYSSLIKK